ncbi:MAG: hypothetical protein RSA44_03985 [Bacteroides sp.]
MKSMYTPYLIEEKQPKKQDCKKEKSLTPSEQTILFLQLFARSYVVEPRLPEGLQGMILS